ncbi:glycosyltransferase family 1 protein [Opitutus sp. GAS368]|uniref:glycosyltransferase family 4 protein n=1 Tax=Opitutus sp. GAS368 TaxID=1882749 RepID=UPI0018D34991|nr:glycosyltransferase family 1 protein [Opitutus sp. GAS368]
MQLVLVTETFSPEINGVAMTLGHLVHGLTQRGHQVTIIRPRQRAEKGAPALQVNGAVTQHLLPGLPIPGYPLLRFGLPAGRCLRRLWCTNRPDLVHIATEGPLGWSALNTAHVLGLPVTSSFHTNFHHYTHDYRFSWLFTLTAKWLRHFHNRTLRTFAPTRELCAELAADGYHNLRVLSRGVDTGHFTPARRDAAQRAAWGAPGDDPVVIHTGRLAREKNYGLIIRAFDAMRTANPRCRFVVVGDGPLRAGLAAKLPYVRFTGFVDRTTLAAHYATGDIYLHASVTETYGNVAAEALASGLAFAGYDYAAAHELVRPEENGLLVPLDDEAAFIAAAVRLATDPVLVARLRTRAPAAVAARSWDNVVTQFAADLAEAADKSLPRACHPGRSEGSSSMTAPAVILDSSLRSE